MRKLKKSLALVLAATLAAACLTGCGGQGLTGSQDWPATVNGTKIAKAPQGVAVLSPNLADVVLSLGYEIQLKGKASTCTQADLSPLPNVSLDKPADIKAKGADLALLDQKPTEQQQEALDSAGVTAVVIPAAQDRAGVSTLYEAVGTAMQGAATGRSKGSKAAESAFLTIDSITRMVPKQDTVVTAAFLFDVKGMAATGDMLAGTLVEAAGLRNVAKGSNGGKLSLEALKRENPTHLFCPKGVKQQLQATAGYKDLDAVKQNRVHEMDVAYMTRQGESMITAVTEMAGAAFPELLQNSSSAAPASSASVKTIANSHIPAGTTLKKGDQGPYVLEMQNRLKELGFLFVNATGLYGDGTVQCVKDFQLVNNRDTSGVADPGTLEDLFSKDAVPHS